MEVALSDVEGIRKTLARFCQYLDERRWEEFTRLFTDDGTFLQCVGRDAILAWTKSCPLAVRPELSRKHTAPNSVIEVTGDSAHVVSDMVYFDRIGDGPWTVGGIVKYWDRLERRENEWLFTDRQTKRQN